MPRATCLPCVLRFCIWPATTTTITCPIKNQQYFQCFTTPILTLIGSLNITSWKSVVSVWLVWCWEIIRDLLSCYDLHSIFDILNIAKLDCVQIKVEVDGVSSVPFRCLVGGRLTESQLSRFTLPSLCLCAFSLIDFLLQCFVLVQFCWFPRIADTLILNGKKGPPIICDCSWCCKCTMLDCWILQVALVGPTNR